MKTKTVKRIEAIKRELEYWHNNRYSSSYAVSYNTRQWINDTWGKLSPENQLMLFNLYGSTLESKFYLRIK